MVAQVHRLAALGRTSERQAWNSLVLTATGQPPSELPPTGIGENASIVRKVLMWVVQTFGTKLEVLEVGMSSGFDALEDRIWTLRNRRLSSLVRDEVDVYLRANQAKPSTTSIFAQAATAAKARTAAEHSASPTVTLHRCKACGATRPLETQYGACSYCGHDFFTGPNYGD